MSDDRSLEQNQVPQGTPAPDQATAAPQQDQGSAPVQNTAAADSLGGPTQGPQQQGPQGPQQPSPQQGGAPQPQQPQKHDIFRSIMETLAGPDHTYRVDANTGKMEKVQTQRSKSQLADSIVAGALTGLFAGAQKHGPNSVLDSFGAGGQANLQRNQQDDQAGQAQAQADFARKSAIAESNMRMMNNAVQLGRLDREDHDAAVNAYSEQLQDYKDNSPDAIIGEHMSEQEASDMKAHGIGDVIRVADGTVPRIDPSTGQQLKINGVPQWDNTYTLIKNVPTTLVSDDGAPKDWVKQAVAWGLPGYAPALLKSSPNVTVSGSSAAKAQHQIVMLQTLQSELNSFGKALGAKEPIDLKGAIKNDPSLVNAIQHFQRAAGASTQPDKQLDIMRQDPKAAPYAAKIMSLFGADNLEKYKQDRDNKQAADKQAAEKTAKRNQVGDANDAQAVLADPNASPDLKKQATDFLAGQTHQEASKTAANEQARQDIQNKASEEMHSYLNAPDGWDDKRAQTEGMDESQLRSYLKDNGIKVPDNFATLYAVGHNEANIDKAYTTRLSKGTGQVDHDTALSYIRQFVNPNFNEGDFPAAKNLKTELASTKAGTAGGTLLAAGTAAGHINSLATAAMALNNNDLQKANEILNKIAEETGQSEPDVFRTYAQQVATEVTKVASGSVPHEAQIQQLLGELNAAKSPKAMAGIVKAMVDVMHSRLAEINDRSMQYFNKPVKGISPTTTQLFKTFGFETPWEAKGSQKVVTGQQPAQQPKGVPAGAVKTYTDKAGNVIGYTTKDTPAGQMIKIGQ